MYCQDIFRYTGLTLHPASMAVTAGMGSALCGHCQRVETCPVLTLDQAEACLGTPTDDSGPLRRGECGDAAPAAGRPQVSS